MYAENTGDQCQTKSYVTEIDNNLLLVSLNLFTVVHVFVRHEHRGSKKRDCYDIQSI